MKKEVKNIDVKELVKEINTSVVEGSVLKLEEKEDSVRKEYKYKMVFSNGPDFALNRITKRTNKTLVSIFSQGILYIYDEITEEKIEITEDAKELKYFFRDKLAEDKIIEDKAIIYAKHGILKSDIDAWYNFMKTSNPGIRFLIKRNLCSFDVVKNASRYYTKKEEFYEIDRLYTENKNILTKIFKEFGPYNSLHLYSQIVYMALQFLEVSDPDTTRYFLEKLKASSMKIEYSTVTLDLPEIIKYNVDLRRLSDYLLFDLYKQGITTISTTRYKDYLSQTFKYYEKIKDKYPKNLATAHDIISSKTIEKNKLGEGFDLFEETMNESEDFSYHNSIDKFIIKMPEKAIELVEEGEYLCHCVASYIEKVNDGDCTVVFMRKSEDPDVPYLTIEILPDRSVPQVEGMNKRSELTPDEIKFIEHWAKKKHLKVTAKNVLMKGKE